MIESSLFLLFSFLLFSSSFMIAFAPSINPVYSVFYLILCFLNVSCLFLLIGVDFLALLFLMIYVGAIAVLFLFVVMMIDLKKTQLVNQYSQFSSLFSAAVLVFLLIAAYSYNECTAFFSTVDTGSLYFQYVQNLDDFSSFYCVANYIYSFGVYLFLVSGIVLLVSMIGCISVTQQRLLLQLY